MTTPLSSRPRPGEDFFDRNPMALPMWVVEPLRLEEYFTRAEITRLCASPTLDEAITYAMSGLGQQVRLSHLSTEDRWRMPGLGVSTSLPGDRYMSATFAIPDWEAPDLDPEARREKREKDLTETLMAFEPMIRMPSTYLAEALPESLRPRETFGLALGLWWDLRLAEGHTRESAQTMLALLVHPDVQSRLSFDETGPVLDLT